MSKQFRVSFTATIPRNAARVASREYWLYSIREVGRRNTLSGGGYLDEINQSIQAFIRDALNRSIERGES